MIKKFFIALAAFAAVVFSLGAVKVAQIKAMSSVSHVPPPSAVTTAVATLEKWHPQLTAVGTLAPVQGVTVSADADGVVVRIAVESGSAVKAGDVLVELDTSVEAAQLASAQAREALAKLQRERADALHNKDTMSQAELDTAVAQLDQAKADVVALRAMIDRKRVHAPFDGRVGIRLVNVGQFVARGRPLLPLQKLDPIYVNFSVPQRNLPSLVVAQSVNVTIDAFADRKFAGTISAINSEIDASTRNVAAQATLANPQELLRAGMFARVAVDLPETGDIIAVPATAIAYAPYGNSVFVVEKMKDAEGQEYLGVRQQLVKIGATRGDLIAVVEGLKAGEEVVTAGVFKLRHGMAVQINNTAQPASNAAPKPSNT